jgi:hypothetical protein
MAYIGLLTTGQLILDEDKATEFSEWCVGKAIEASAVRYIPPIILDFLTDTLRWAEASSIAWAAAGAIERTNASTWAGARKAQNEKLKEMLFPVDSAVS